MTSESISMRLTKDGKPLGFLEQLDEYRTLLVDSPEAGICRIVLNRPDKLNAFDERMLRELRSVIWSCNFDESVRVIIITGAGRGFCAGRDISGLDYENNLSTPQYRAYVRANHEALDDIEAIEKPVIAAINGVCAGGGVEIAIACDFRMAAQGAQFLLPENQLGVIPAAGAASRMIQMIGIGRLKEMMIASLPIDADEAYRIGLATRVFPKDELMDRTLAFARTLLERAPQAMGMAKQIINACQNIDTDTGRFLERLGQSVLIQTDDNKEGMRSFIDKRRPKFTGK